MSEKAIRIDSQKAKVLFDALQTYQQENVGIIHGWTLTERTNEDTELYTSILTVWGIVEELKTCISKAFPENPAH